MKRDPISLRNWKIRTAQTMIEKRKKAQQLARNTPKTASKPKKAVGHRKAIKKVSAKRAAQNRQYSKEALRWKRENVVCIPCWESGKMTATEDVHHQKGKIGALLLDKRFWLPVCRRCHDWIHNNPSAAREKGYLYPAHEFNTVPKT